MNCPRCEVDLERVEVAGYRTHLCRQCEGVWFDGKGPGVLHDVPVEEITASKLGATLVADQRPNMPLSNLVSCPVCHQQMKRHDCRDDESTELDYCVQHGMWLDDGELPRALGALRRDPGLERRLFDLAVPTLLEKLVLWFRGVQAQPA